jgi:hypothetical protein
MTINFIKNGIKNEIKIDTYDNITIKYFRDLLSIRTQVTDFVPFIAHCRYRYDYPYYIKRPDPEKSYFISERKYYEISRYTYVKKSRDVHRIEKIKEVINPKIEEFDGREFDRILPRSEEDIVNIPRDRTYSRLSVIDIKKNIELILVGRPDKISRIDKNLIIEEDKPGNLFDYAYNPFEFHILQASVYIKSKFSYKFRPSCGKVGICDTSSYVNQPTISQAWNNEPVIVNDYDRNDRAFFDIPHQKKMLIINIKDPKFQQDIENNAVAILAMEYDNKIERYLNENLSIYMNMISASIYGNHYDNFNKCNLCLYIKCPIRLIRHKLYQKIIR